MKYQFIKTIIGISLAICTAYSAIRSAYTTVVMPGIAVIAEKNAGTTEEIFDDAESTEEYFDDIDQGSEEADEYNDESDQNVDQGQEDPDENYAGIDQDQRDSDEYYTEPDQGSNQPEVTLADYLAGLRCGACGRNCSLLSPRCRNGMFKAQQAEQEYYEIYGK